MGFVLPPAQARTVVVDGYGSTEAIKRADRAERGVSIVPASTISNETAAGMVQFRITSAIARDHHLGSTKRLVAVLLLLVSAPG